MGIWAKIIGGAVVGVGAVAAAPFTGGGSVVGALTLAASLSGAGAVAAGAGVAGAAAGIAIDKYSASEDKEKLDKVQREAKREGEQIATRRYTIELDKMKAELESILKDVESREQFLVTALAVGICAANADHEICDAEKEDIEVLVAGLGREKVLSEMTQKRIKSWYETPPNLITVWNLIEENDFNTSEYLKIFGNIVMMVVLADDEINEHEEEFIVAWESLAA
ncbi:hypothetical protein AB4160_04000 [Shewanella sp. 10N.286.51.B8]|uniref:hypothetical protein n=1 Tax=Shewanella sp. 10N.286.51.B8 TaxID=3229708 RepID=UPI0035532C45